MKTLVFQIMFLTLATVSFSQNEPRFKHFNLKKNVAIDGYDPVSYFNGSPLEGVEEIQTTYKGVVYLFASRSNLAKFKLNPDKYEPAYGGWCAYAMGASGEKVKVDPETFKIIDGRVYLFYNFWGNNTLTDWNDEEKELKDAADRNWRKFDR